MTAVTENGVRKTEGRIRKNLLFCEFKETFLLCKKRFACFDFFTLSKGGGFFATLANDGVGFDFLIITKF